MHYEARNLERFGQNFLHVDFVKFPTPVRPLVTADVLVETFEVRIASGSSGSREKALRGVLKMHLLRSSSHRQEGALFCLKRLVSFFSVSSTLFVNSASQ